MLAFLSMPADMRSDPETTRAAYVDAIKGLSPVHSVRTLRRFRNGALGDGKWAPLPGELRKAIEAATAKDADYDRQRKAIDETLAERAKREERAGPREELSFVADYRAHLAGLADRRDSAGNWRPPTADEAHDWLEANADSAQPEIEISPALAERLEQQSGDKE